MVQNKILNYLRDADGYLSGEEISRQLKITRAGIWKYIQELRQDGYEIVAVPHLGYRLTSLPDKLIPVEIQHGLKTDFIGKDIQCHDSVTSTMDVAFQLGVSGAADGTVVCAESQTKGKGRLGRSWISPKGKGIYMSVILRPRLTPSDAAKITLLSAVAVCEALQKYTTRPVRIKWPNDILIDGKKVAGILTELSAEMDRVRFVVIGVGVNVNTTAGQLPPFSTSLRQEGGQKISRTELMREVLVSLEGWYQRLQEKGFSPILARWKELTSTLGQMVRIVDANGDVEGQAIDIDESGGLILRGLHGVIVKRMTGDVIQMGEKAAR